MTNLAKTETTLYKPQAAALAKALEVIELCSQAAAEIERCSRKIHELELANVADRAEIQRQAERITELEAEVEAAKVVVDAKSAMIISEQAERIAELEWKLTCAEYSGDHNIADLHEYRKRAEKAEAERDTAVLHADIRTKERNEAWDERGAAQAALRELWEFTGRDQYHVAPELNVRITEALNGESDVPRLTESMRALVDHALTMLDPRSDGQPEDALKDIQRLQLEMDMEATSD